MPRLTSRLSPYFQPGDITEGAAFADSGHVSAVTAEPHRLVADVAGKAEYGVDLTWTGREISAFCSCPEFMHGRLCPHIWAALLHADRKELLNAAPASGPLHIARDERSLDDGAGPWMEGGAPALGDTAAAAGETPNAVPGWKRALTSFAQAMREDGVMKRRGPGRERLEELIYVLSVRPHWSGEALALHLWSRRRGKDGGWAKPRPRLTDRESAARFPDAQDRRILATLFGGAERATTLPAAHAPKTSVFTLTPELAGILLEPLSATGRLYYRDDEQAEKVEPLVWNPATAVLTVRVQPGGEGACLEAVLERGERREPAANARMILHGAGIVLWNGELSPMQDLAGPAWTTLFERLGPIFVPAGDEAGFVAELVRIPGARHVELPPEWHFQERVALPQPVMRVLTPENVDGEPGAIRSIYLPVEVVFAYDGALVRAGDPAPRIADAGRRLIWPRDAAAEGAALEQLVALGVRTQGGGTLPEFLLPAQVLPEVAESLTQRGWRVEARGRLYAAPRAMRLHVATGIDWFELDGGIDFDGAYIPMPAILAALRRGERTVVLAGGGLGVLPAEWLERMGLVAGMGEVKGGKLRFQTRQAALLDALLGSFSQVTSDAAFDRIRRSLHEVARIEPRDPPPTFQGTLRPYQREGLGWLWFFRGLGLGGCLADDMGLGKTVQVLALLESLRHEEAGRQAPHAPALIVVPKSLVFNWRMEAERFAPHLRVLDYTGPQRAREAESIRSYDVVLTTYGTLRRDAVFLKDIPFALVILDEAQAIKNPGSDAAKAARLLRADYRLALTGTPIENHLDDLWSIFEFLNPGMLGGAKHLSQQTQPDQASKGGRALLARALRPFILRRKKSDVARDLPDRIQQTLYCELEGPQREIYEELRDYYRSALLNRATLQSLRRSKLQVLEALLRLRQAACHPALLDERHAGGGSSKVDALIEQLADVIGGGHKALIFSQFTSFLALVRPRLEAEGWVYEYLDGKTRDRQVRTERFQTDPGCPLFLISLKAGGTGLNLTAAEYVFILDPWWNPAVEAQAIDRAHRIGQTRNVFAYSLIAKDTVEERVLELQNTKRELADAIITADNSLVKNLEPKDLELLLS